MSIYLDPSYFFKYAGDYVREYADVLPVCCSIDNYFIPLFAGLDGTYISHEAKKAIIYNLKDASANVMDIPRTVSRFQLLIHQSKPRTIITRGTDELGQATSVTYKTMKHFLYMNHGGTITPLYALCCGNKDIYTLDKNNPDYTKLFLLINPLLLTAPHKVIAGRVKPLIKYFQELHVNIMYTENVGKLCLQETTFKNTFKTIDERMLFVRLVKQRIGLYVPSLPQSEIISEPVIAPMEQVTVEPTIEVPEDQATGTISWPDPTFVEGSRRSTTVTGTSIPYNMYNYGVSTPSSGWVTSNVEDLNALQDFNQGIINESYIEARRRNLSVASEGILNQVTREEVDNGVADNTVISAATHEPVQAGFIDRSAFPVREVEFTIIDDLEPEIERMESLGLDVAQPESVFPVDELEAQMAAMRATAVVTEVLTGPRPDPSILNDPSLLINTSTNIAF